MAAAAVGRGEVAAVVDRQAAKVLRWEKNPFASSEEQ